MTELFLALVLFAAVATDNNGYPICPEKFHLNYNSVTKDLGCCTIDGKCLWVKEGGLITYGTEAHPPPLDYKPVTKRDPKQVAAFRRVNACPSTQKFTGACKGWVIDHIIPLCWGGEDKPLNMQWQEQKASYIKDVFERQACAMKKGVQ